MRKLFFSLLLVIVIGASALLWKNLHSKNKQQYCKATFNHQFVIEEANAFLGFNLVDPQQAPPEIKEEVMRGYQIVLNTPYHAPEYVKNELSCSNCHFSGGDTLGGKNGGISLVGVTTRYPQFSERDQKTISLTDRINNCFKRSMNGIAPPADSQIMSDVLVYLAWISKEVEYIEDIPWLGLPSINSKHEPNADEGEKYYQMYCASCHQPNGSGGGHLGVVEGKTIPPLWGPDSFNDGAGMCNMRMLAPFIFLNMPYKEAVLTEEKALDIAAYIRTKPRPHFNP